MTTPLRETTTTTLFADGSKKILSSNTTTQSSAPSLALTASTSTSLTFLVTPNSHGDAFVTSYELYQDGALIETFLEPMTREVTGLTSNSAHTFYVRKITTLNDLSSSTIAVRTLSVQPSAPVVSAGAVASRSATVQWTAEANGDAVVQKYEVLVDGVVDGEVASGVLTYTTTSLTHETSYTFAVRKVTNLDDVVSTNLAIQTTPLVPASAPVVSVGELTTTSAVVTWTAEANGDAVIQKYVVLVNGVVDGEVASDALTYTAVDLTPETSYAFVVRKVTDLGDVDSSGMFDIKRKVFTGGAGTFPANSYTTLGREATEDYESYAEGTGYGDDVDEIYFNTGSKHNNEWVIIKSLSGMYYSIGVYHSASNRLGRLDADGNMDPNTENVHVRVPNDILNTFLANNPTKKIKTIACSTYSAFVLMEDGTLYTYGSGKAVATINATTSKTELVVASLYTELMNQGWVGHDVVALRSGVGVHLKHDSFKDRIYFSGTDEYNSFGFMYHDWVFDTKVNGVYKTEPVENLTIKHMIEVLGFVVEEIRGMDIRVLIKMSGEWFGMGNAGNNKTLGISWTEASRAYPGAPDPRTDIVDYRGKQNYTGPIKLDGLNKFLTDNPGSTVNVSTGYDITIYTPEGKFYFHRNQANYGQKFPRNYPYGGVSIPWEENPKESPYMDLNYIGDPVGRAPTGYDGIGFLENVNGTFIKFYHFSNQALFVMGTSTEYASVQTLAEPAEPVVEDGLAAHTQIHSLVYNEGMYWPDGSFEHARSGYDNVQPDEIVLKTPHPLANVTGDLKQVIHLSHFTLALDTNNKMYVYGLRVQQLVQYQFLVDSGATGLPSDWYAWQSGAMYREAAALNTHLANLYPGKTIKELHALGVIGDQTVGFLIEYDDRTIHIVAMSSSVQSRTYYSPDPSVITVTGLGDGWVLHKTITLGGSGLVFMKRVGSSAPYKAFIDEFQQYDKDDASDGNNVRIFGFALRVAARNTDVGLASITTTDGYTNQYMGALKASIASANWANQTSSGDVSAISMNHKEPLRLYWTVHHLKELLALGYLPTKTIPLRWSALVLFENSGGDKEWHTINFGPDMVSDTYHTRLMRTAQYLLKHNNINGYYQTSQFYTLGWPSNRSSMLTNDMFVRLQAVMAAAEALGTGMDDLVFADSMRSSRYDGATSNSTVLQVYVNSTKKAYQLGKGVDMSDVNWMEITPALLDADSYDYMDLKNGPSSSIYGDNSRIHSWLFANGAFENTKLLQFSTSYWGMMMLTEPVPQNSSGPNGATKWLNFEGGTVQTHGIASDITIDPVLIEESETEEFFYQTPETGAPILTFDAPDNTYALFIKFRPVAPPGRWDDEQNALQIRNGNDLFMTVEIQGQGDRVASRQKNPYAIYKYGSLTMQPPDEYLDNPSTTGFTMAVFFNKNTGYLRLPVTGITWDNEWVRTNDNTYYTVSVDAWNATQSIVLLPSTDDCQIQLMSVSVHEDIDEAQWVDLLSLYA